MVTVVRLAVWDEIQEAIELERRRVLWPDIDDLQRMVLASLTSTSSIYATLQGRPLRCALCGHILDVHSQILPFAPCLDCDCIGWTVITRPNPSRATRW